MSATFDRVFQAVLLPNETNLLIDFACIFPIVQQGVGICGGLVSLIKLAGNLAKRAFKEGCYAMEKNSEKLDAEKIKFRTDNNNSRNDHLIDLAVNILRVIPIIGTLTSVSRLYFGIAMGIRVYH